MYNITLVFYPDTTPLLLSISRADNQPITSWEHLQAIKDVFFPHFNFYEVFPHRCDIINNCNERHLWSAQAIQDKIDLISIQNLDFSPTIRHVYDYYLDSQK